ncbi:MAG TPA: hypothetical protein VF746_00050 [Longimicrobium sp.]|jgi:hypothetical protein
MIRRTAGCALAIVTMSCAPGPARGRGDAAPPPSAAPAPQAGAPVTPLIAHHQHLRSPVMVARSAAQQPPLPAVALPEELAGVLRRREAGWNDAAALAPLFTEESLVLDTRENRWIRGRAAVAAYLAGNFALPHGITPVSYAVHGSAARVAGYFTRVVDGRPRHFGTSCSRSRKGATARGGSRPRRRRSPGPRCRSRSRPSS